MDHLLLGESLRKIKINKIFFFLPLLVGQRLELKVWRIKKDGESVRDLPAERLSARAKFRAASSPAERLSDKEEAEGSIPSPPTKL